jgi:hypothetical protein
MNRFSYLRSLGAFLVIAVWLFPRIAGAAGLIASPDQFWRRVDRIPAAPANARVEIQARRFVPFTVDASALRAQLSTSPKEFTAAPGLNRSTEISLPKPDGTFARFRIEEVEMMEPALAAKFPDIKTYRGRDVNDPMASLQLDINARTLHAQVLSPSGTYYIDPYWQHNGSLYMTYWKSDLSSGTRRFKCLLEEHNENRSASIITPSAIESDSGKMMRKYRLACATSLAYSQYHGGMVPDVNLVVAALVTLNNRVSGVYETEFGIRMILVANEDQIIASATNPTPYTDTPGDIFTNPAYIDQKIGEANYDIGHVVTTGSGGIAGLGVVCRGFDPTSGGSAKARGTTGINPPVGDGFWIDFVAHEMGHQFGGNHTFDGNDTTNCGPNQNASTAYEPGSGSTIQAYAGVCGNEDLQPHSDPYWHFISLVEMFGYASGGGSRPAEILLDRTALRPTPKASPGSGTLDPSGADVTWTGNAVGFPPAADESACVEGVNCDTFTLTLGGTREDWQGKAARITISWPSALDDYDVFVHKGNVDGPLVDDGTNSGGGPEVVNIDPSSPDSGTGTFAVRVVYFAVVPPAQQYSAVATVIGDGSDPGPAPTCAVLTATGNNPPTVSGGLDYRIPARTPFMLTAANGTDPDGDPITYCWEEADLGPGPKVADDPDDGVNPIIRSYPPTPNPTRTIPRWSNLLANQTQTRGEHLPTTTRQLNFRVTVRDNRFGGFGMDSKHLDVVDTGAGFKVTSPNTAVTYAGGSSQTVTWDVAGTTANGINTSLVNILLTTDATTASGDPTFPILLVANTPNDGSQSVTMPMVNTTKARIMVQAVGNIYFDISDTNFTITAPAPQLTSVVSRKTHGAAGPFDINLPSSAPFGIECRSGGATNDYTFVFTFNTALLNVGSATVSGGAVKATSGINPGNSNQYILETTGLTNAEYHTVTLNNVNGDATIGPVTVGILRGDTTGNGSVNASDVGQTKAQSGMSVTASNFRQDVTVNGSINASDVSQVKTQSGTALP